MALFGHVAAGGELPSLLGVLVPLTASVLLALALIGRKLSIWRISLVVIASQSLFHWLFVLGSPGSASSQDHMAMMGHSGSVTVAAHAMTSPSMSIGHGLAALLTIAALVRGEQALRSLIALLQSGLQRIDWVQPAFIAPLPTLRIASTGWIPGTTRVLGAHGSRGPPALI